MKPLTPAEVYNRLIDVIDTNTDLPLSDGGMEWLERWCRGTGRDHEPRAVVFASEKGEELVAALEGRIVHKGKRLDKIALDNDEDEISGKSLYQFSKELDSRTPLCNDDPPPEL